MKAIQVNNLVKHYGKVKALDDVSFSIDKGSVCGILGPNGSGKTTTIKSICNLIIPDSGDIQVLGSSNRKNHKHISALFEGTRNLYWRLTPIENLRYFAGIRGYGGKEIDRKINELLDRFNLSSKKNTPVNKLSRGMQQRVALAMTLICDTEIILLDEPTLGLDVQSFMDIKDLLTGISKDLNKTILLSTHDMQLVQDICDQVVILSNGKVVTQSKVSDLLDDFKKFTYEIKLSGKLSEKAKQYIESSSQFYLNSEGTVLETDIKDYKDIYKIMDSLKQNDIIVKEVRQKEMNIERIYMELTTQGGALS